MRFEIVYKSLWKRIDRFTLFTISWLNRWSYYCLGEIAHFWHFPFIFFKLREMNPNPTGLGTIPTGSRPENPRELTGKMFQNSGFITSHLKKFHKILRCEVMKPEFWNIFFVSSREFSGWIPFGIVPSPVGK